MKVHHQLIELAGTPPFAVKLGDTLEEALSFEELRDTVLGVAQKGISLQRFKGLGEMNADQLRETTMDPSNRTLARWGSTTPPARTGSSRCSWATRSSRGATSSRATPASWRTWIV